MSQAVLTKPEVEIEPYYPQCYLYQPEEVELQRNLIKLETALFITGVNHESAHQAAKVITSIKPGFIISRAEYQAIHQAFSEMK
ncbi:MAG: hypothetical protein F6J86_30520 [Symploca sp. SIO1B1]|nr:hypothetical protein [Symploca sp. SIO1A3]NER98116.1 hypothetical protein [Symploca sp. SIO1B1]NET61971.1 hypothetical protein [Symploca sp. SIO2E6]